MDPNSRGHYEHTWCRGRVFQFLIVASSYKKGYLYQLYLFHLYFSYQLVEYFSLVFQQVLKLLKAKATRRL